MGALKKQVNTAKLTTRVATQPYTYIQNGTGSTYRIANE